MKFNVQDLVDQGLVKIKKYPDRGLNVLKYSQKVFWDNLWHLDDRLLECRGLVVDNDWNVISKPLTKRFNLGENEVNLNDYSKYHIIDKLNGFMFAVTYDKTYGFVYSSTGTLDSDYVNMAKDMLTDEQKDVIKLTPTHTFVFECCHPSDPHIVHEDEGLHLISLVVNIKGEAYYEVPSLHKDRVQAFHKIASYLGEYTGSEIKELIKSYKREGFMVLDQDYNTICKIKSPYYLTKKFFMRVSKGRLEKLFNNPQQFKQGVDEEYYDLLEFITKKFDKDTWESYSDQERRKIIEKFLEEK